MEAFYVTKPDLTTDCIAEKLCELKPSLAKENVFIIGEGYYENVLDLLLFKCRSAGLFKRKLPLPQPDVDVVLRLLLQAANKELTGDSLHVRSELFELRSKVEKARGSDSWPPSTRDSTVDLAAGKYQDFLKKCNLVDTWSVCSEAHKIMTASPKSDNSALVFKGRISSNDVKTLAKLNISSASQLLVSEGDKPEVTEPSNLDVVVEELQYESFADPSAENNLSESDNEVELNMSSDCPGFQSWVGLLRLLVNTRDEISLARVLTQTGLLSGSQCQVVRQETDKSSLAMYQNIVSYVTQTSLGGKGYAPDKEHPFAEFEDKISELVKLMEKLQTKLEETQDPAEALEKVTVTVKAWLQKLEVRCKTDLVCLMRLVVPRIAARQAGSQNNVAFGILGKPGLLVKGLVDLIAAGSEEEVVDTPAALAKTPSRNKTLLSFFRTPQQQTLPVLGEESTVGGDDLPNEPDEFDLLANEEGVGAKLKAKVAAETNPSTPQLDNQPYARFKSSLGWAVESSPVPESAGRSGVRVGGSTLVAAAAPDTPLRAVENVEDILAELKEKQEEERRQEIRDAIKDEPVKAKSRKRILAKEAEEEAMKKFGVENEPKKQKKEKAPAKSKKKIATPKGQKKMTAFFTKS